MDFDNVSMDFSTEMTDLEIEKPEFHTDEWTIEYGGSISNGAVVKDGVIYFAACDYYLYAIDRETRELLWKFKSNGCFAESRVIIYDNTIYIGSYDGHMYAIGLDGDMKWKFKTGAKISGSACPTDKYLAFGSHDNNLYVLDRKTGNEVWRFRTGGELFWHYPPLLHEGVLYFASFDNYLYALEVSTSKLLWKFNTGKYGNAGIPAIHGNRIYHGERGGTLYCLDMKGKELWRFVAGETLSQLPLIHDDKIYFGTEDNNMYCLNSEGKELWRFRTGGYIYSSPRMEGNVIYFGSWDCHVYAVNADTGKEIWRFAANTLKQSYEPPPRCNFKMELKRETQIEGEIPEEKYSSKDEESGSLSSYQIENEYSTTSDYKTKSDYDVSMVMFEHFTSKEELIWISGSEDLRPDSRISI